MHNLITIGDFALVFGLTLIAVEDVALLNIGLQDFSGAMGDLTSSLSILHVPHEKRRSAWC